ncbi:uncharacterized protein LOC129601492 isoform X3 [Paramacrobiotus metropolitanus]|uniref:uncharacterized protein LOC129601492 isoform X3 n=1 Tax=Paramacrobiotus metropolitanus TaxID=2943436 RepID=UPI0024462A0D|nr:uncharacterized protein LOC129601492 isoform X3 [Paramacrobiotus metropolitanus]
MAEDEGTKPFPSQNDLTGFTTVENPAPGTKMDVYVTRSLTNLDELLGLRQNFIYPQDLEFVMLADDRKRIKDVFDWATQLSNPSRSIDSTTSDAENNELCQENMPARNDYLQHIASPESVVLTSLLVIKIPWTNRGPPGVLPAPVSVVLSSRALKSANNTVQCWKDYCTQSPYDCLDYDKYLISCLIPTAFTGNIEPVQFQHERPRR